MAVFHISREATARAALARVTDGHALGSIARHAEHESVRRAAFDGLHDHAELLSVALNSELKDPTLAAVERITDRGELEQIATRAKNKSASKRARAIVEATTHFQDPARIAKASEGLGEGMKGIEAAKLSEAELLQTRGW